MAAIRKTSMIGQVNGLALAALDDSVIEALDWDLPGTSLKLGSRSTVTKVDLNGGPTVIKQYKTLSLRRRLRYAVTRSRARQSWETGQEMADLGLPIVRPIAFFEESRFGIPGRAILLSPFQKGTSLDQHEEPQIVFQELKKIFEKMASHQVTHGDLKASNIIIDSENKAHFIDNDAARLHRSSRSYQKGRKKDERQFLKNWENKPKLKDLFSTIFDHRKTSLKRSV